MTIAVIGGGMAALEAVKALRAAPGGKDFSIHVFSDSGFPPYNPMLTTYYCGGKIPWEELFPAGQHPWEELGVTLHTGTPVMALSAANHTLRTADAETFSFDKCLIATGASPFVPPFPGHDLGTDAGIFVMRTAGKI
jgi:assimilatory nitrate reductase electron transfer subunit/3-phenylpropionate/trans-cinnamate dioxygenase ferredoxin reductase subunit